jgi:hypothetical protein
LKFKPQDDDSFEKLAVWQRSQALAVRRELKEISRMINGLIRSLDRGDNNPST